MALHRRSSPTSCRNASSRRPRGPAERTVTPALTSARDGGGPRGAVELGVHRPAVDGHGAHAVQARRARRRPGPGASTVKRRAAAAGDDVVDRPVGDDRALVHDDDVRAGLLDLGEQVARHQHGAPARGVAAQDLAHGVDLGRVEPVGRLVEHEQLRQPEHGLGDREPLAHALAVGADPAVDRVAEAGDLQCLSRCASPAGGRWRPSRAGGSPHRTGAAGSRGPRRTRRSGPAPARRPRPAAPNARIVPGRRPDQAHEHAQHGRLAGAVRAEQAQHHAALDVERHPAHRREAAAVGLGEVADLRSGVGASRPAPAPARSGPAGRAPDRRQSRATTREQRRGEHPAMPISGPPGTVFARDGLAGHAGTASPRRSAPPSPPARPRAGRRRRSPGRWCANDTISRLPASIGADHAGQRDGDPRGPVRRHRRPGPERPRCRAACGCRPGRPRRPSPNSTASRAAG